MTIIERSGAWPAQNLTIVEADLAPRPWEVAALFFTSILSLSFFLASAYIAVTLINGLVLATTMGMANWQLARTSTAAVWTPLFAFRLATFVFLGVGPLLPNVLGDETRERILQLYPYTDAELAKVLLIWIISVTIVITSCRFYSTLELRTNRKPFKLVAGGPIHTLRLGLIFFLAGLGWLSLVEVPQLLGWFEITIPGSIALPFQAAGSVGIFLIALWAMERGGFSHFAYLIPLAIIIAIGLITFNKTIIIGPLLFISLAILFRGVTVAKVTVVTAILLLTFAVLQPMVAQARFIHAQTYGSFHGGSLTERLGYAVDFIEGERIYDERETNTFARLVYNSPATFVVMRYDLGLPDDSIQNGFVAMVPRIIWPGKPVTTATGRELNELITGRATSQLAATIFADIYWNWGWYGLFVLLIPYGVLLWPATRVAHEIVLNRDWLMMPFVMLVFRICLSVDSSFVPAVLVPALAAVIAYALLRMVKRILSPQERAA
jgi:hypothetical protein